MSTVGIIAEYNPFHSGHEYHIAEAKRLTGAGNAVVVMSGDFVQRGEPAICDKYIRATAALMGGADIVFQLPVRYSTASAEEFAQGAVSALCRLGSIDYLCFGTEGHLCAGDLMRIAEILTDEPEEYRSVLREQIRSGVSFPNARETAFRAYTHDERLTGILRTPNNILAVEYCKALLRQKQITTSGDGIPIPVTVPRVGTGYHDLAPSTEGYLSASGVRERILYGKEAALHSDEIIRSVPGYSRELMEKDYGKTLPISIDMFSDMLFMRLKTASYEQLISCNGVSEELLNSVLREAAPSLSFSGLIKRIKTKNLTYSGVSRALLHMMLGITDNGSLSQLRLLGLKKSASSLLKAKDVRRSVDIINKPADADRSDTLFMEDIFASECYARAIYTGYATDIPSEFKRQPVIL